MITGYTSAITEVHYAVLAQVNGDCQPWQNPHFEIGQTPANGISLPIPFIITFSFPHLSKQP